MLYVKTAMCHRPGLPGLPSQAALLESEQDPGPRGTSLPPLAPHTHQSCPLVRLGVPWALLPPSPEPCPHV